MDEIWKNIEDYKGAYQVSNLGRVRSLDRYVNGKYMMPRKIRGKIRALQVCHNGYLVVGLYKCQKIKLCKVHRLVAKEFLSNDKLKNKVQINHINLNKKDNRVVNLEWVSGLENRSHAHFKGAYPKGENAKNSRITDIQAIEVGELLKEEVSFSKIKSITGVSISTIGNIKMCRGWKHLGLSYYEFKIGAGNVRYRDISLIRELYKYSKSIKTKVKPFSQVWLAKCYKVTPNVIRTIVKTNFYDKAMERYDRIQKD